MSKWNYWYKTTDSNNNLVMADAEFDPNEELVSIILYELKNGAVGDLIKELLPEDVSKPHLEWIKTKWKKERVS